MTTNPDHPQSPPSPAPLNARTAAAIAEARGILAAAGSVLVLTGAGISRASGIPTSQDLQTQDPDGAAWLRWDMEHFTADPCTVWACMEARRQRTLRAQPNAAHLALARWVHGNPNVFIVTQNVDGLHERAGCAISDVDAPATILRLHGTLHRGRCVRCQHGAPLPERIDSSAVERLPHCERCGALLRPAIVWFNERLSQPVLVSANRRARSVEVCVVIGTQLDVYPAASLPELARSAGAWIVEMNPHPTLPDEPLITRIALAAEVGVPLLLDGLLMPDGQRRQPGIDAP